MIKSKPSRWQLPAVLILVTVQAGCAPTTVRRADYSHTALERTDFEQAFTAAEKVMRNQFGYVTCDQQTAVIEAKPTYFQEDTAGWLGQINLRRRGRLMLQRQQKQWWAYVQVVTERNDTQVYSQFQRQRHGLEYEVPTPLEADLNTTPAQRQVWTKIKRDRNLEAQILGRLREDLGLATPAVR